MDSIFKKYQFRDDENRYGVQKEWLLWKRNLCDKESSFVMEQMLISDKQTITDDKRSVKRYRKLS